MSNYATKANLKHATRIYISRLAEKSDWVSFKSWIRQIRYWQVNTCSALTEFENKTPSISSIKKKDCNVKISKFERKLSDHDHDKDITTPEFTNLAAKVFTSKVFISTIKFSNKDRFW